MLVKEQTAMEWEERSGRVTQSFDEWKLIERDVRAFVSVTLRFAAERYEAIWSELAHAPGDPDGPDLPDLFDAAVEGLWPSDHEWMVLAAAIKDGVTAYEVYLERALEELLRAHHLELIPRRTSLRWHELAEFYADYVGVEIGSPGVASIRTIRNVLTHRRGELRTEELRNTYDEQTDGLPDHVLPLTKDKVYDMLDTLAAEVRRVDAVVYPPAWGPVKAPALVALRSKMAEDDSTV